VTPSHWLARKLRIEARVRHVEEARVRVRSSFHTLGFGSFSFSSFYK